MLNEFRNRLGKSGKWNQNGPNTSQHACSPAGLMYTCIHETKYILVCCLHKGLVWIQSECNKVCLLCVQASTQYVVVIQISRSTCVLVGLCMPHKEPGENGLQRQARVCESLNVRINISISYVLRLEQVVRGTRICLPRPLFANLL